MTLIIQDIVNALSLGGLYALLALGIALIFGVMGFVNFAHGELIMIGGYVLFYTLSHGIWLSIAPVLVATIIAAMLMERVAFRPLRDADPTTLLITSFAVSFFLQNLALVTVGGIGKFIAVPTSVSRSVTIHGIQITRIAIIEIVVTLIGLAATWLFLGRTGLGLQMRAASEDFGMARYLGVRANRVIAFAFALSGLLAGVVSLAFVMQVGSVEPTIGLSPVLVGFVAVVIGGLGSLLGAVIGGFALGGLTIALQSLLPSNLVGFRDAFMYGCVIALLVARPSGLLKHVSREVRV
jgi:branched-chain amino acid transport system permease protein